MRQQMGRKSKGKSRREQHCMEGVHSNVVSLLFFFFVFFRCPFQRLFPCCFFFSFYCVVRALVCFLVSFFCYDFAVHSYIVSYLFWYLVVVDTEMMQRSLSNLGFVNFDSIDHWPAMNELRVITQFDRRQRNSLSQAHCKRPILFLQWTYEN